MSTGEKRSAQMKWLFDGSDTWSKMRRGQGTRTQGARRRHFFVYLSNIRRTSAKTEKARGGLWTLPQRRPRLLRGGADESCWPKSNEDRSHSLVSESGLNLRVEEPGFRSISKWPDLMYWHLEPRNTFLFIERVCVPEKRYAHQFQMTGFCFSGFNVPFLSWSLSFSRQPVH